MDTRTYTFNCQECGKENTRVVSTARFCIDCSAMRSAKRYWVKKKDIGACYFCLSSISIVLHHIDRNRDNNVDKNLIPLCSRCHQVLHSEIYKKLDNARLLTRNKSKKVK